MLAKWVSVFFSKCFMQDKGLFWCFSRSHPFNSHKSSNFKSLLKQCFTLHIYNVFSIGECVHRNYTQILNQARRFLNLKNVPKLELKDLKMGRTKIMPTLKEPPQKSKVSKLTLKVLLNRKNCMTLV
jgi:hypothetical protein